MMRSIRFLPSPTVYTNPKTVFSKVSSFASAVSRRRLSFSTRAIIAPEPPWVDHSPPTHSSSHDGLELSQSFLNSCPNGRMPFSLRLVQQQKKSLARRHRPKDPSALCPIGGSVWFLICLLEELHKSSVYLADEATQDKVFWDSAEALIWLFLRVFSASPNLLPVILGLTAGFIARSVEKCVVEVVSSAFDLTVEPAGLTSEVAAKQMAAAGAAEDGAVGNPPEMGNHWSFSNIGILDDPERVEIDSRQLDHSLRRSYYESMIVREGQSNSLIFSNYAQFLYQFERDLDRARDYFKLALMIEPVDGEVFSKYAKFLWHGQGDLAGAEEMFLKAIEADPTCSFHQSSYANFLWQTGGDETCFPLDAKNDA